MKNIISCKFGGTSMGSSESIMICSDIVNNLRYTNELVVTVSAISGMTNSLAEIITLAKNKKPKLVKSILNLIEKKHFDILDQIDANEETNKKLRYLFKNLKDILEGVSLVGDITSKVEAKIFSFGEKMSSLLISTSLQKMKIKNKVIESEQIIRTDSNYLEAQVDFKRTKYFINKILLPLLERGIIPIVTGFIGKDTFGDTTLLGRGGSDYTASIIGTCLNVEKINIYTDVNGIMSCDPRIFDKAISWDKLDVGIASEMSYSGAKVIHPKSIFSAIEKKIPIYILNTFDSDFKGTQILSDFNSRGIKGIVGTKNDVLITIENPNMLESFGFISKMTDIIAKQNVEIDVCASSEISFTFSIKEKHFSDKLIKSISKKSEIVVKKNVSKICIIGNNILNNGKILLDIFEILNSNDIKVYTISSGGNANNITFIIDSRNMEKSVELLHKNLI